MIFYGTKNKKIGSKAIMWGLGEPYSHFAVGFGAPYSCVVESTLENGAIVSTIEDFLQRNTVVEAMEYIGQRFLFSESLYKTMTKHQGKKYDQLNILWWTMTALGKRLAKTAIPRYNQWEDNKKLICVEILEGSEELIKEYLHVDLTGIDLSMTSPYQLMRHLSKSPLLKKRK